MAVDGSAFRKRARAHRLGLWLTARAGRHPPNWIDRLAARALTRAIGGTKPDADFMRDELVDADPGFTAEQLANYAKGDGDQD